jgi:hypothetical protein
MYRKICLGNSGFIEIWQEWRILHMKTDETIFNQIRCGKCNEVHLCLLCCGRCRGQGNVWFSLKLEILLFVHWKFHSPNQKLLWPPNFPSFSSGPLRNLVWPPEGVIWLTLSTTALYSYDIWNSGRSHWRTKYLWIRWKELFETLKWKYSSAQSISFSASDFS